MIIFARNNTFEEKMDSSCPFCYFLQEDNRKHKRLHRLLTTERIDFTLLLYRSICCPSAVANNRNHDHYLSILA